MSPDLFAAQLEAIAYVEAVIAGDDQARQAITEGADTAALTDMLARLCVVWARVAHREPAELAAAQRLSVFLQHGMVSP